MQYIEPIRQYVIAKWHNLVRRLYEIKEFEAYRNAEYEKIANLSMNLNQRAIELENKAKELEAYREMLSEKTKRFEEAKNNFDPLALQRHNLAGDIINADIPEIEEEEGFYAEANSLSKNKTLQKVIQTLHRTFLENIAYRVDTEPQIKWNRARSDGLDMLTTTLEKLGAEKEQYDRRGKETNGRPASESAGTDEDDRG